MAMNKISVDDVPQFTAAQLTIFFLLPVSWWFFLLYVVFPTIVPYVSGATGEVNGWSILIISSLAYCFEFSLALFIFHREGYDLNLRSLKERIHWNWPSGKTWIILVIITVVGFTLSQFLQPLTTVMATAFPPPDWFPASQHPFKEVHSVQEALPGVVFSGNYLFLILVLFTGSMNIIGEDLLYRGAFIPKLHGLFGKWAWVAGGVIWTFKHSYVWWRMFADAAILGFAGAYIFGPLFSLPAIMLIHLITNFGATWPLIIQAVFSG